MADSASVQPHNLVGTWSIERDLYDQTADVRGSFSGRLVVAVGGSGFDWHESGSLIWGGRELPVFRDLGIRLLDGEWWMTFADGRPFHPWRVDTSVEHPCAEDMYRGLISVTAGTAERPTGLSIRWDVTGPQKDQLIVSRLNRLGD
jgi:hypothetical protein